MAEKSAKKASGAKKAAAKADTEGHASIRNKAVNTRAKVAKKAAPAAADTEGHIASRAKGSSKR